jgi:hypothetical protein
MAGDDAVERLLGGCSNWDQRDHLVAGLGYQHTVRHPV